MDLNVDGVPGTAKKRRNVLQHYLLNLLQYPDCPNCFLKWQEEQPPAVDT
jgi:hypothetical protein